MVYYLMSLKKLQMTFEKYDHAEGRRDGERVGSCSCIPDSYNYLTVHRQEKGTLRTGNDFFLSIEWERNYVTVVVCGRNDRSAWVVTP